MKKLMYFMIPICLGLVFTFSMNNYLDYKIEYLLNSKDLTAIKNDPLSDIKDKGSIANNHFLKNKDIFMLGTSELGHSTKQHPTYYFNTNRSKNEIIPIGRAYKQSLQDSAVLGSLNTNIEDRKVVLLISMQWFMDKEGVTPHHYQARFSPSQFYNLLNNNKISKESKLSFIKRSEQLLKNSSEYKPEYVYAKLYSADTFITKMQKFALSPYFELRKFFVNLKEKGTLYSQLAGLKNKKNIKPVDKINWNDEYKTADEDAKKRVGNNIFNIDKGYYKKNFGMGLDKIKNKYKDVNLLDSKEFKDYELELKICKELGIKPEIIMLPAMDKFYNMTGISKKERHEYYDKLKNVTNKYGFNVMDLRDKENELYYLRDVMHLGTKGWVDVNEKLFKLFNQE